jgi:hypothetical protein
MKKICDKNTYLNLYSFLHLLFEGGCFFLQNVLVHNVPGVEITQQKGISHRCPFALRTGRRLTGRRRFRSRDDTTLLPGKGGFFAAAFQRFLLFNGRPDYGIEGQFSQLFQGGASGAQGRASTAQGRAYRIRYGAYRVRDGASSRRVVIRINGLLLRRS